MAAYMFHDRHEQIVDGDRPQILARQLKKGWIAHFCPDFPISIDQTGTKLEHILSYLIANAVKFTPQGTVKVDVKSENDSLVISMTDTGIGIKDQEYRTDLRGNPNQVHNRERNSDKGYGLGLASLRDQFARQIGGELRVESSQVSEISSFFNRLPARTQSPHPSQAATTNLSPSDIRP